MNPTMMPMIVKVEQEEMIRRAERQRTFNNWQTSNRSRSLKKLAFSLAASGVVVLLVVLATMAV